MNSSNAKMSLLPLLWYNWQAYEIFILTMISYILCASDAGRHEEYASSCWGEKASFSSWPFCKTSEGEACLGQMNVMLSVPPIIFPFSSVFLYFFFSPFLSSSRTWRASKCNFPMLCPIEIKLQRLFLLYRWDSLCLNYLQ